MPTANPRITITLEPHVALVLRTMSEVTEQSQSAIVGELLQLSTPVFERVIATVQAARQVQESAKSEIAAGLDRAQARLEDQMQLALGELDEATRPLLERAEEIRRRSKRSGGRPPEGELASTPGAERKAAPKGSTPVPVTRGSGTSSKAPKRGKRTGAKGVRRAL